jgi:hypothetical protein
VIVWKRSKSSDMSIAESSLLEGSVSEDLEIRVAVSRGIVDWSSRKAVFLCQISDVCDERALT